MEPLRITSLDDDDDGVQWNGSHRVCSPWQHPLLRSSKLSTFFKPWNSRKLGEKRLDVDNATQSQYKNTLQKLGLAVGVKDARQANQEN
ncbi:hypothetical protein MUK42_35873 [Musa troglodytarum]|uniref:Uncharacterized protein n=1 Tax=Musa troglodytarum TaxID=320322 RepID=A0A9E7H231_9LILI|nr:hypothetical protein MUK42_35873 [Musa troglodytarum]